MSDLQKFKRAIDLKRQAIPLIKAEIMDLEEQFILFRMKERFESKITNEFDPVLSRKLEIIDYLLNN